MLTELYIRNYALIEELTLGFDGGLSVITGETGTGKSILLGALALILGKRAETDVLKNPGERCIVEGHFDIRDYGLEPFFLAEDIEYADLSILRREIHPNGKSRAFINDSPVSLAVMKALGDQLVDIHSQHKTWAINQSDVQLALLDEFAGLKDHVAEVQQYYQQWNKLNNRLIELELREKKRTAGS
jgi:DNA repair protein RecN (Recombination protein N)